MKGGGLMKIGFVGAGKVGFSLGKYMTEHGVSVSGYYSKSSDSAREASEFTNTKYFDSIEEILSDSDVLFLTVPDGAIKDVWDSLKQYSLTGKFICHCSGAMSSSVFSGIGQAKAFGYSIHPLFAVCDKLQSYRELSRAYFTIEYSDEESKKHCMYFKDMFEKMGNEVRFISAGQKVLYHSAAVFASNLVTGLYSYATELLQECGFDEESSEKALAPLFMNNCENVVSKGIVDSLTGPVERADSDTIKKHMEALPKEQLGSYKALSERLIKVAKQKNPDRDYSISENELYYQNGNEVTDRK